jgi:hypothetical protein
MLKMTLKCRQFLTYYTTIVQTIKTLEKLTNLLNRNGYRWGIGFTQGSDNQFQKRLNIVEIRRQWLDVIRFHQFLYLNNRITRWPGEWFYERSEGDDNKDHMLPSSKDLNSWSNTACTALIDPSKRFEKRVSSCCLLPHLHNLTTNWIKADLFSCDDGQIRNSKHRFCKRSTDCLNKDGAIAHKSKSTGAFKI